MNRRHFLKAVAAVPLAAVALPHVPKLAFHPKAFEMVSRPFRFERITPVDYYIEPAAKSLAEQMDRHFAAIVYKERAFRRQAQADLAFVSGSQWHG